MPIAEISANVIGSLGCPLTHAPATGGLRIEVLAAAPP